MVLIPLEIISSFSKLRINCSRRREAWYTQRESNTFYALIEFGTGLQILTPSENQLHYPAVIKLQSYFT